MDFELEQRAVKRIIRLFQMQVREGGNDVAELHENGTKLSECPLGPGELVFGVYRGKYYFTPRALYVKKATSMLKVEWRNVVTCSTSHGDGRKTSVVTLNTGETMKISIGEMATGWSGRISQLFHDLIKMLGCPSQECRFSGPPHLVPFAVPVGWEFASVAANAVRCDFTWRRELACTCGGRGFGVRYVGDLRPEGVLADKGMLSLAAEGECKACHVANHDYSPPVNHDLSPPSATVRS